MRLGTWLHFPYSGGAWDQPESLLTLVKYAWQAWYVFGYKPKNAMKWTVDDAEFIDWVNDGTN